MRLLRTFATARTLVLGGSVLFHTLLVSACGSTLLGGGPHTFPGSGPGGKPMTTATDAAVGLPAAAKTIVYPVTASVSASDNYFGTKVADPYR